MIGAMSATFPIPDNPRDATYVASAGQTHFPVTWPFQRPEDLAVRLNGVVQALGTHYAVTGAGQVTGGAVTLSAGAAAGAMVRITGLAGGGRITGVTGGGRFDPQAIDRELDRHTIRLLEARRDINAVQDGLDGLLPQSGILDAMGRRILHVGDPVEDGDAVNLRTAESLISDAGLRGATGPQGPQGARGMTYRGTWVATAAYTLDDVVSYLGSTYICVLAHAASPTVPTSSLAQSGHASARWSLLAAKGAELAFTPVQQGGGTNQSGNKVYIGLANVATGANHLRLQVDDWDFGAAWPITPTGSVQQGGGASQGANRVYIGWADAAAGGNHLRAQVDALDLGRIWTDFSAPRSLTVPGHHTFPTGLIQQGGISAAAEIGYVVFPITFPNAVITVVCTGTCGTEVGTMPSIGITNMSNSTFSFVNRYVGGSGLSMSVRANPNPFRWFAMGF